MEVHGVPVSYFALSDMFNLVLQARAFPDLVEYLDARLTLPDPIRRTIGREGLLYEWYLLNESSFGSPTTIAEIEGWVTPRRQEFRGRLRRKAFLDRFAPIIEGVSDALATRRPDFADGLDPVTLAAMDPDQSRGDYLRLTGRVVRSQADRSPRVGFLIR